ncbi:hypothetical protein LNKW23_40900 [Paralimibaculum aggregatum]|uniref:Sulfotransferase family protein n=1 Tax=Paralimibaculum aggregatum TaxID=3036245 RepID=A0ABQ6LNS6_9RHOB|nr:sulfotransferase family 2 domain-containing protein [Limibaculum sp. NKW23]GMG84874.1 hypothetical protein LNKW23_40900 [Limibaculum sp. NKW23]
MPDTRPESALPFHRRWPSLQAMPLPQHRLLYLPIAKNACTSLKRLTVELSPLPAARKAEILHDVHTVTDTEATGLQLKDHDAAAAAGFLAEPGWMRFAVLRDPHDRLVSAYVEKFVIRRERKGLSTAPVVAAVQGCAPEDADLGRGVRFRDFLAHVLASPAESLDPHWRPQIHSFAEIACTHLYAMEHLDLLAADLSGRLGQTVTIGAHNRARPVPDRLVPEAATLWPEEIAEPSRIDPASFYDAESRALVARYFAADLTLHRSVLAENRARVALAESMSQAPASGPAPTPAPAPDAAVAPRPWRKRLSLNGLRRLAGRPAAPGGPKTG